MKELTPEQIQDNWSKLRSIITDNFSGERLERMNEMYDYFEERMCLAPASGKEHFHNAHPGGYVEHILHITDFAQQLYDVWEKNGATVNNFTKEEQASMDAFRERNARKPLSYVDNAYAGGDWK